MFSTYNGGATEKYRWNQTLWEINMQVPIPGAPFKSSQLLVEFKSKRLKVALKSGPVVVEGELHDRVKTDECLWSLEEGKYLNISMEKSRETWWKCVLEGDVEIDTTKVDSTRNVETYDEETQAAIRKIMFDQSQKAKGLKTSDELTTEDVIKKAWDAEGSPFKGQPFDPNLIKISK
eukprot:GILI01020605.1.p1 GENE.GILI01020605.1~~GILI01020605.1.p1  ORF type:complete len:201 (+),score=57.95 GILI01020605.1:73-603(+)